MRAQLNCTFVHTDLNLIVFIHFEVTLFINWYTIVSIENELLK
jgi:hypothetical protein